MLFLTQCTRWFIIFFPPRLRAIEFEEPFKEKVKKNWLRCQTVIFPRPSLSSTWHPNTASSTSSLFASSQFSWGLRLLSVSAVKVLTADGWSICEQQWRHFIQFASEVNGFGGVISQQVAVHCLSCFYNMADCLRTSLIELFFPPLWLFCPTVQLLSGKNVRNIAECQGKSVHLCFCGTLKKNPSLLLIFMCHNVIGLLCLHRW